MFETGRKKPAANLASHAVLLVALLLTLYPFIFMVLTSLKTTPQFYHNIWSVSLPPTWGNYATAWQAIRRYIAMTLLISGSSALGVVLLGCVVAYIFARFDFPCKRVLYGAILSVMMIPGILVLVPSFMIVKQLHMLNTPWALVLPYIAGGQVLAIFLLRQFIEEIPHDLFDSATIDGASHTRVLWHVALPLARPIIGVIAIMDVLGTWNNLIWPYVVLNDARQYNLPVGLFTFAGQYGNRYGEMFAGYTLASIPLILLFAFTTRTFLKGITGGSVKI